MIDWTIYNVDPGDLLFGFFGIIYLIYGAYIVVWNIVDWFKSLK
jgi:hypothetical protein